MDIGNKLRKKRLNKNWTQKDVAKKIGTSSKQISLYEKNLSTPSIVKLIKLAKLFNLSIDYLLLDKASDESKEIIKDRALIERFTVIENLSTREKSFILRVIDCLLLEQEIKKVSKFKKGI